MKPLRWLEGALIPAIALMCGLVAALLIALIMGESPWLVFRTLILGALGSPTQVGYSLYYATPLIFTGLSVAWAFKVGLFNIGGEGQMAVGGTAMAIVGILGAEFSPWVALPLAFFSGFSVGGLWGALAGWMKAKRGCHEVLTTILLNFVAYGLTSFLIVSVFRSAESQVPETAEIGLGYRLAHLGAIGGLSPLNWSLPIALIFAAVFSFLFRRSMFGFRQSLTGGARGVAQRAGINVDRHLIFAMFISGGLAGLAGSSQILGFAFKARDGFTSGAGFVGIAVALLGRNSAFGIVVSALLFGILSKGALDLDLDTEKVTRDLATVIQAFIVLAVACSAGITHWWIQFRERKYKVNFKNG